MQSEKRPPLSRNRRLQFHPLILLTRKRHPQLQKLNHNIPKLPKENPIVGRIPLHMLLKQRILNQRHIRRQHHQALALNILKLLGAIPLLIRPLLAQQEAEVVVRHHDRGEGPGAVEAGAVGVAAAEGVGAAEGDDLAVVEAHAAEDGAQVGLLFGAVGEAAVGGAHADVAVGAAGSPGDYGAFGLFVSGDRGEWLEGRKRKTRTLHFLYCGDAGESPEVGVCDPGKLFLDWVQEISSGFQAGVRSVVTFRGESHGGAVGATGVGQLVVSALFFSFPISAWVLDQHLRSAAVPCQSYDDGTITSVVVVILLFEKLRYSVVYLLVVLLFRCKDAL